MHAGLWLYYCQLAYIRVCNSKGGSGTQPFVPVRQRSCSSIGSIEKTKPQHALLCVITRWLIICKWTPPVSFPVSYIDCECCFTMQSESRRRNCNVIHRQKKKKSPSCPICYFCVWLFPPVLKFISLTFLFDFKSHESRANKTLFDFLFLYFGDFLHSCFLIDLHTYLPVFSSAAMVSLKLPSQLLHRAVQWERAIKLD